MRKTSLSANNHETLRLVKLDGNGHKDDWIEATEDDNGREPLSYNIFRPWGLDVKLVVEKDDDEHQITVRTELPSDPPFFVSVRHGLLTTTRLARFYWFRLDDTYAHMSMSNYADWYTVVDTPFNEQTYCNDWY